MTDLPEPFTDLSHDVEGLPGFMLNTQKIISSELLALSTGDAFKAAVVLWCRAWNQKPAGSLPNDDAILAGFSGTGSKWPKVKEMALRGFVLCSDGRLYNKTLCDDVRRAALAKAERHERTRAATEARIAKRSESASRSNVTKSHRRDETRQEEEKVGSGSAIDDACVVATIEPKPSKGTRISRDFQPDQSCQKVAKDLHFTQSLWDSCLAEFLDYWVGVPGARGTKLDWQATFRNQLRKYPQLKGFLNGKSRSDPSGVQEALDELRRENQGSDDNSQHLRDP